MLSESFSTLDQKINSYKLALEQHYKAKGAIQTKQKGLPTLDDKLNIYKLAFELYQDAKRQEYNKKYYAKNKNTIKSRRRKEYFARMPSKSKTKSARNKRAIKNKKERVP